MRRDAPLTPAALRLLMTLLATAVVGCGAPPATAPSAFAEFHSDDGAFACEYPEGWEASGKAARGIAWATFRSGPSTINLRASASGSLVSDAMGGRRADTMAPDPTLAPVHFIHVEQKEIAEGDFGGYTELPGSPIVLDCPLGPARLSEFTATTPLGGELHGYRVTVIGNKKGVNVRCVCRESDWNTLKPAFDHLLTTLRRGEAR